MRAIVFAYHNMGIAGTRALLDHGFTIPMVLSHEDDPGRTGGSAPWRSSAVSGDPGIFPEGRQRAAVAGPDPGSQARPALLLLLPIDAEKGDPRDPAAGAMNLHGSLLPKYRGRAPVNWVLVKGETETG